MVRNVLHIPGGTPLRVGGRGGSLAASFGGDGTHKRHDGGNPMNLANAGNAGIPLPAGEPISLVYPNLFAPELR